MTSQHLIRFADLPISRWANGKGDTVELARHPASDPFEWRLSIATITEASAFSPLPGVARVLMALTPGPLALTIDGAETTLARHESVTFTGDQEVAALGPRTPQRDLNLMARSGIPTLEAACVADQLTTAPDVIAVIVLDGELSHLGTPLHAGDAVITNGLATTIDGCGTVALAAVRTIR